MPSEHSSGNDGKPAFSDSDVLAATEERGETMDVNLISALRLWESWCL